METSLVYDKKRSQLQENHSFNNCINFNEKNSLTGNKRQKWLEAPTTIYCAGQPAINYLLLVNYLLLGRVRADSDDTTAFSKRAKTHY